MQRDPSELLTPEEVEKSRSQTIDQDQQMEEFLATIQSMVRRSAEAAGYKLEDLKPSGGHDLEKIQKQMLQDFPSIKLTWEEIDLFLFYRLPKDFDREVFHLSI